MYFLPSYMPPVPPTSSFIVRWARYVAFLSLPILDCTTRHFR
jgi:hypothetical protein